jgi:hypothetical protein
MKNYAHMHTQIRLVKPKLEWPYGEGRLRAQQMKINLERRKQQRRPLYVGGSPEHLKQSGYS